MPRVASVVLAAAVVAFAVPPLVNAQDTKERREGVPVDQAAREAKDRAEIEALMWRYVRSLDSLNADAYAANYTPDGSFGNTKGQAALKKMVADMAQQRVEARKKGEPERPPMFHVITNPYIEFVDKDHAIYRSYWMTVFGAAGQGTAPRVAAAGRGIDHLVRVNGKWLIQSRNVAPAEE